MFTDPTLFFTHLASVLSTYGYPGLFIVSFLSAIAIPIPASVAIAASGALAAQGYLNIYLVLLVSLLGNVAADVCAYLVAKRYGEALFIKIGFGRLLRSGVYRRLARYIQEFPQIIIYSTRFITEAGPAVNILSGLSGVPYRTFLLYDLIGETSYVLLFALAGYFLGDAWQDNTAFLFKGALVLVSLGVTIAIVQMILRRRLRGSSTQRLSSSNTNAIS